jgi:hypothetical protein
MRLGGSGEIWMMIGPLIAVGLVVTLGTGGGEDLVEFAQDLAIGGLDVAVRVLRR